MLVQLRTEERLNNNQPFAQFIRLNNAPLGEEPVFVDRSVPNEFKVSVNPVNAAIVTALMIHIINGHEHQVNATRIGTSHLFAFTVSSGVLQPGPYHLRVSVTVAGAVVAVAEIELDAQ